MKKVTKAQKAASTLAQKAKDSIKKVKNVLVSKPPVKKEDAPKEVSSVSKKVADIPPAKVKTILVSQPKPETDKSPYYDLAKKCNVKIDFRPFIHVEGISAKDFRQQKINIMEYSAVIFTSRNAIDHYFRICAEMRINVPETMKYFCVSESTAYYIQKYVQYRKRKIFFGKQTFNDLIDILKKHKDEKFLLPCSDIAKEENAEILDQHGFKYAKAVIYKTVSSDILDLADVNYDILVFFSPAAIKSLFQNFPKFKQKATRLAAFGPTTAKAIEEANLTLNIYAPNPKAPSMTMALEQYIMEVNKK